MSETGRCKLNMLKEQSALPRADAAPYSLRADDPLDPHVIMGFLLGFFGGLFEHATGREGKYSVLAFRDTIIALGMSYSQLSVYLTTIVEGFEQVKDVGRIGAYIISILDEIKTIIAKQRDLGSKLTADPSLLPRQEDRTLLSKIFTSALLFELQLIKQVTRIYERVLSRGEAQRLQGEVQELTSLWEQSQDAANCDANENTTQIKELITELGLSRFPSDLFKGVVEQCLYHISQAI